MAEQAHFAKYKISLKNNNKESQQVNESTRGGRKFEISILRKFESSRNSRIREFRGVDKWKKGGEIFEISPPLSFKIIVVLRFVMRQRISWKSASEAEAKSTSEV